MEIIALEIWWLQEIVIIMMRGISYMMDICVMDTMMGDNMF